MNPTPPVATAGRALEVLSEDECYQLLRGHHVGRIGLSVGALPVVVPVNYVIDGDRAVICSEPGAKLDAARHRVVACLEIDDFDPFDHAGWSVMMTGRLTELTDQREIDEVRRLPLTPWLPMTEPHYLELTAELVSGRRLGRA